MVISVLVRAVDVREEIELDLRGRFCFGLEDVAMLCAMATGFVC